MKIRNIFCLVICIVILAFLLWQNSRIEMNMKETALRDGFKIGREIN